MNPIFSRSSKIPKSRFSPQTYATILVLLSLSGLATSGYLALSHYRNFTDISYQSFCAISRAFNCDTVSQSPYAVFSGVPVAVWGMAGYLFFMAVWLFFRGGRKWAYGWASFTILGLVFSLISISLAIVSASRIRSYCLMCIVTYGINLALLYVAWLASRRFGRGVFYANLLNDIALIRQKSVKASVNIIGFAVSIALVGFFYPNYWNYPQLPTSTKVATGVTKEGSPWIGARQPSLTIIEFTDYLCFQCGKMHSHLRQLVNRYPDKIRLVHRHFPLDQAVNHLLSESVHPNSGVISLFAIVAEESGKFWQVNDLLFREARNKKAINLGRIAEKVGLKIDNFEQTINERKVISRLEKDIRAGLRLKITATPSYLIDGEVYHGTIPPDIIARTLEDR